MPLDLLQQFADESKPIRHADLLDLSGIAVEELQMLRDGWPQLSATRRIDVISRLLDLAEDNPEANFDAVFAFCLKDEDEHVREKAIAGLWECEERTVLTALILLLRCDSAQRVRAAAAQALGKFIDLCQDNKLSPRDQRRIQEVLLLAATNPSESQEVRRRALEASSALQMPEIMALIKEAYQSQEPKTRSSAIYAMGRNGDLRWLPLIIKEMASDLAEMRYEAAAACGLLGAASTVPKLLPMLRDDDLQVRLAALSSLGAIGGVAAKKALQTEMKSPDEVVREAAEAALSELEYNEDPLSFRPQI